MKKNIPDNFIQYQNIRIKSPNINLGIQIMRALLCLWIVIKHCSTFRKNHKKYLSKDFHVPTFFLLSFYFYYPIIFKKNIEKVISRFQRLSIISLKYPIAEISLKNCCLQILLGSPIHYIFWFQFNLIFASLIFAIISFSFNKMLRNILLVVGLFNYFLHLSKLGYNIINRTPHYLKYNIRSLIEMIPLAVNGSFINSINLLSILNKYSTFFKIFLFCILFLLFQYDIFVNKPGVRYPKVSLNLIASLVIFMLFGTLSLEKIKKKIFIIIKYITQFTGGIYYIHSIVNDLIRKHSNYLKNLNYSYALIIYIIISYFICFFGIKLFKNYKLKYYIFKYFLTLFKHD